MSHELNLFLYFKDKQFFESVVLPQIKNKTEKYWIDRFLLNDFEFFEKEFLDNQFLKERLYMFEIFLGLLAIGKSLSEKRNSNRDLDLIKKFEQLLARFRQEQNANDPCTRKQTVDDLFDMVIQSTFIFHDKYQMGMDATAEDYEEEEGGGGGGGEGYGNNDRFNENSFIDGEIESDLGRNIAGNVNVFQNAGKTNEYIERQFYTANNDKYDYYECNENNIAGDEWKWLDSKKHPVDARRLIHIYSNCNNYHIKSNLHSINKFWMDLLEQLLAFFKKGNSTKDPSFLSPNFMFTTGDITEVFIILAIID